MARFYQAATSGDYIDYIGDATKTRSSRPEASGLGGLFANVNVLPEDRARAEELFTSYDSAINDITAQIAKNPKNINKYAPALREIGAGLRNEFKFGEIAAIQDRYNQYQTQVKTISETFKDSPYLQQAALRQIKVNPLDFDPTSRTFGKVDSPNVVKPFTTADQQTWLTNAEKVVKDKILSRVDKTKKLDRYNSLYELGEEVGVGEQDIYNTLTGLITPDMVMSSKQRKDLLGIANEEDKFYTKDASGKIVPNLNTEMGQLMYSVAQGLKRNKMETKVGEYQDEGRLIAAKGAEDRKTAKFKDNLEVGDVSTLVDKLVSVTRGDEETFSTSNEDKTIMTDNFLEGLKLKTGQKIKGTIKQKGGMPLVKIENERVKMKKDGTPVLNNGKQVMEKYETVVPLDLELIETVDIPEKTKRAFFEELENRKLITPERTLNIDYTQDLGRQKPNPPKESKGKGQTAAKIPPYLQK